jgi:hypothetical protein
VLHPDWNESQVIAMTDHYIAERQKQLDALPQTVSQVAQAENAANPKASLADVLSILPRLLAELHIQPRERTSITGLLSKSEEAILGSA